MVSGQVAEEYKKTKDKKTKKQKDKKAKEFCNHGEWPGGGRELMQISALRYSPAGPSGINNFNPGIFGTGFCKNPGIPGFSGSGLASIFNPGIV